MSTSPLARKCSILTLTNLSQKRKISSGSRCKPAWRKSSNSTKLPRSLRSSSPSPSTKVGNPKSKTGNINKFLRLDYVRPTSLVRSCICHEFTAVQLHSTHLSHIQLSSTVIIVRICILIYSLDIMPVVYKCNKFITA